MAMDYKEIVDFLTQDYFTQYEPLAGIVLMGSFSAGQGDALSDLDVEFVYYHEDSVPITIPENGWFWDSGFRSLENYPGFEKDHWMCGAYVTAQVLFDRSGRIQQLIDEFARPGFAAFADTLGATLDGYYNAFYRSMKCIRRQNVLGKHTMACQSLDALNTILYQINGSIPTYINRLPATIKTLAILPLPSESLLALMTDISTDADGLAQIELFLAVKKQMNELGFQNIYEDWDGVLDREIETYSRLFNTIPESKK